MINTAATAGILYGISLVEGIRQLPSDAIVLRRFGLGRWYAVRHDAPGGLRIVSWCLPLSVPLVLSTSARPDERDPSELKSLVSANERPLAALRLLGVLTLIALVVGLPVAVERSGLFGLLATVILLGLMSVGQALWTGYLLRGQGMSARATLLTAVRLLNPFTAPRAAEIVYASMSAGMPGLDVAFELLGNDEFVRSFRRDIYDKLHNRTAGRSLDLTAETAARLASLLATSPSGTPEISFCPRCASEFAPAVAHCSDCDDVALVQPARN